jgi:hypothetical protein
MKYIVSSISLAALLALSGCGGDSSSATPSKTIKVERGPILGAVVVDAEGQVANEDANGSYTFEDAIAYPVSVFGGYIDINRNGQVDAEELVNSVVLEANEGNVLTILSTMLSNGDAQVSTMLLETLGLDKSLTPSENMNVAALSDEIFKYLTENNLTSAADINASELETLMSAIQTRMQEYSQSDENASQLEASLVAALNMNTLDAQAALQINENMGSLDVEEILGTLSSKIISEEQKEQLLAKVAQYNIEDINVTDIINDINLTQDDTTPTGENNLSIFDDNNLSQLLNLEQVSL